LFYKYFIGRRISTKTSTN